MKSFRPPEDKTVVSGTWSSLCRSFLPIIATPGQRRLVVRDLLPQPDHRQQHGLKFAREDSMRGGAGYQTPEGSTKPRKRASPTACGLQPVVTLAHWLGASRVSCWMIRRHSVNTCRRQNALPAAAEGRKPNCCSVIRRTGHLKGLCPTAAAFAGSGGLIDAVGQAISALAAVDREADSVVVNVSDWWSARQDGTAIRDFRDVWAKLCCASGLGRLLCRDCTKAAAAGEEGQFDEPAECSSTSRADARSAADRAEKLPEVRRSSLFSAICAGPVFRNMCTRRGVQEAVAMKISGHKTRASFRSLQHRQRGAIFCRSCRDDRRRGRRAEFGHSLGIENDTDDSSTSELKNSPNGN